MRLDADRLKSYSEVLKFEIKVKNAQDNLDLVDYYNHILSGLLTNKNKDVLNKNKHMILSNIENLLETVDRVKEFVEEEL